MHASSSTSTTTLAAPADLESILSELTTTPPHPPQYIANSLRTLVKRDVGDAILASLLPGGIDPLAVLDPAVNTLGFLFIISARLSIAGAPQVSLATIAHFCSAFNPADARLAPERITYLARAIVQLAESQNLLKAAVAPLYDLTTRYAPSLAYLTTLHPNFLHACVASHHYTAALPVLAVPISEIDTSLSPLTYNDVLTYHYTASLALLALHRFPAAASHLEAAATLPAHALPAALQLESLKKLLLLHLILHGAPQPLPKYTHPALCRALKNTPYVALVKAFSGPPAALHEIVAKESRLFQAECNMGLVRLVVAHAPRWAVRTLTATYMTLSLPELARALNLESDEPAVRALILSMIERNEIPASIDAASTVTFHLGTGTGTRAGVDVDEMVRAAQMQGANIGEVGREIGRGREFLAKAVKERDGSGSGGGAGTGTGTGVDELELYAAGPGYRDWDEGGF